MEQPLRICMSAATSTICLGSRETFESRVTHFIELTATAEDDFRPIDEGTSLVIDTEIS